MVSSTHTGSMWCTVQSSHEYAKTNPSQLYLHDATINTVLLMCHSVACESTTRYSIELLTCTSRASTASTQTVVPAIPCQAGGTHVENKRYGFHRDRRTSLEEESSPHAPPMTQSRDAAAAVAVAAAAAAAAGPSFHQRV